MREGTIGSTPPGHGRRNRFNVSGAGPLVLHIEAAIGFGGEEIRILEECRWLLQHGWRVLLLAQPDTPIVAHADEYEVPVHTLRMASKTRPGPLNIPWAAVLSLRELVLKTAADLIHSHSSIDSHLVARAYSLRWLRIPIVRSRHISYRVTAPGLVYWPPKKIITSGEAIKNVLAEAWVPKTKIVSIPAGVDQTRFHPGVSGAEVRREFGLLGRTVGLVANLRKSKGIPIFLDAAKKLAALMPDVRFLIVGDGPRMPEVKQGVEEKGLSGIVHVAGFRADIPAILAALDVLTVPSTGGEGVPQIVLQALAVGTPVIATTIGGIPEVIKDGQTGVLIEPGNSEALLAALRTVFRNSEAARERALAGQKVVLSAHTLDHSMARTTAVYSQLLSLPGQGGAQV